jgi:protocatechuate 3,4-dioxygenase beta subunit
MEANDCSDTGEHGCEFVAVVANHDHNKGDCCSSKTHYIIAKSTKSPKNFLRSVDLLFTVRGLNDEPIAGAALDVWQADGEGLYEGQRHTQGPWMRGLYHSQPDGSYAVRRVAPIGYTIPMDGTVGKLLNRAKNSHMRPAPRCERV